jgi:CHAD domain-containing protein
VRHGLIRAVLTLSCREAKTQGSAGLAELAKRLQSERVQLIAHLQLWLQTPHYGLLKRAITFLPRVPRHANLDGYPVSLLPAERGAILLLGQCRSAVQRLAFGNPRGLLPTAHGDLHDLRLALKQLRFHAEFFRELFPAEQIGRLLSVVVAFLSLLGEIQDATVGLDMAERLGACAVVQERLQRKEANARAKLLVTWPACWVELRDCPVIGPIPARL